MFDIFSMIVSGIYQFGVSLGVGASTVAITLWLIAQSAGPMNADKGMMLKGIYKILRVGMIAIGVGLILSLLFHTVVRDLQYAMQWAFFGVLCMNAILMTYHKIPMSFAPALQAATWYALFLITVIPVALLPAVVVACIYVAWVFVVYLVIRSAIEHGKKNVPPASSK